MQPANPFKLLIIQELLLGYSQSIQNSIRDRQKKKHFFQIRFFFGKNSTLSKGLSLEEENKYVARDQLLYALY